MAILKSRLFWVPGIVVAIALAVLVWVNRTTNGPDFALIGDHTAVSVSPDSQAVMAVKISSRTSAPPVKFSFSHVPDGVTVTAASDPLSPDVAVISVATSPTAKPGNFQLAVTGTSGSRKHRFTVPVSIVAPAAHVRPPLTMVVNPATRTVISRGFTRYNVITNPGRQPVPVTLSISGLPTGATATFTQGTWPNGAAYILRIATTIDTAPGTYLFDVHAVEGTETADAQAYLVVVNAVVKNFTISGNAAHALRPGSTSPINVAITNTFKRDLNLTGLTVALHSTSDVNCTTSNFTLTQYSGPTTLVIPAHSKRTLSQLGVPTSAWPKITMLNLPTNQDDCKGVTINLTYAGSGGGT